ncbi:hypothetical protein VNO78_03783 [Psophocarpus tetragonolobus]|uniref:CBS domain-containing protein n=1 Tax=Psophocarpus tetragonolobus TaxID=3891 RepID=A0AAN9T3P2_PSOTE
MAARLCGHVVSDLCLGKQPLRSLSASDTVGDALAALKSIDDTFLSVWNCHHSFIRKQNLPLPLPLAQVCTCICIGKVCMLDIICFLSKPSADLHSPVSALLHHNSPLLVRHLPPTASLLEAIDVMHDGVHNLVIPIQKPKQFHYLESNIHTDNSTYCWLTQEDLFRYLLNSIPLFSPTHAKPINSLGIIDTQNLFAVFYDDPASSTLDLLSLSLFYQSSIAILDSNGKFASEISPFMLNSCDDSLLPAIATLSAGDLSSYILCGGPLHAHQQSSSTPNNSKLGLGLGLGLGLVCHRSSSLVAVMIQALAHRVSYVWVVEHDGTLTGIVTFQGILKVFRDHLQSVRYIT